MNKMLAELQQAKAVADDQTKWAIHIAHIKMLSELLLDDHDSGDKKAEHVLEKVLNEPVQTIKTEQRKDTSIFDF